MKFIMDIWPSLTLFIYQVHILGLDLTQTSWETQLKEVQTMAYLAFFKEILLGIMSGAHHLYLFPFIKLNIKLL